MLKNDILIEVEHVKKTYKLFDRPQDRIKEALNPFHKRYSRDFMALDDISFSVKRGECVGILGKNGAGKSTILKILTGVLTQTSGKVKVNGKVSALLELGGSFNPEMTGIENIYLNGTLMGLTKKEIDDKVNDIIEFADIGSFIYQPVKMYSSGMFARLAFAVSINVEPDILIIDEALSVGDIAFQYKCFQKMMELKEKGIALILVSHSTQQILQNCDRALLLNSGKLIKDSKNVINVINDYEKILRGISLKEDKILKTKNLGENLSDEWLNDYDISPKKELSENRMGSYRAIIRDVHVNDSVCDISTNTIVYSGNKAYLHFKIYAKEDIDNVILGVSLRNKEGVDLWVQNNLLSNSVINLKKGVNFITYEFRMNLVPNQYLLCPGLVVIKDGKREELDHRWPVKIIDVVAHGECGGIMYSPIKVIF